MTFSIMRFILSKLPDKWRVGLLIACLMESSLIRPGQSIDIHMNWEKDGTYAFRVKDDDLFNQ